MPLRPDSDILRWLPSEPQDRSPSRAGDGLPLVDLDSDDPLLLDALLSARDRRPAMPANSPARATPPPESRSGGAGSVSSAGRQPGELWLDGDVLMCACPDCIAPMSIRLWLMIADCWRCGTSIELTEEQQREAERLLRNRDGEANRAVSERTASRPPAAPSRPAPSRPAVSQEQPRAAATPSPAGNVNGHTAPPRARAAPAPPPAAPPRTLAPPTQPASQAVRAGNRRRRVQSWLNDTPAWLVSLVVHLILLTLLGLLTFGEPSDPPFITLSTTVSRDVEEGDNTQPIDPQHELAFDLPLPQDLDLQNSEVREALVRADQDARELRLSEDAYDPFLPDLANVKDRLRSNNFADRTLAARDPRVRKVLVTEEGGTTLTEAAVARGLRWLAQQQKADGRWTLDGGVRSDSAATSLALLPFLGAGQTHLTGKYQQTVAAGLRWLLAHQLENGDLAANSAGNSHMYAHGQGAIVLCEAFAITGDEQLRLPAQKAIDFIVAAQHDAGGWRYEPGQPGDTSVLGWQLMALQSARAANLAVPPATLENASHYLDSVASHDGARYSYMRGNGPTEVMTAEALLCRMYLGWTMDDHGLAEGVRWLADNHLPSSNQNNLYYWYYGTQVFHHVGGLNWEKWNVRIRDILVNTQEKRGSQAGSWTPEHHHDRQGGRLYATSLAVCTLEVYYRHTPLFRQLDVD